MLQRWVPINLKMTNRSWILLATFCALVAIYTSLRKLPPAADRDINGNINRDVFIVVP